MIKDTFISYQVFLHFYSSLSKTFQSLRTCVTWKDLDKEIGCPHKCPPLWRVPWEIGGHPSKAGLLQLFWMPVLWVAKYMPRVVVKIHQRTSVRYPFRTQHSEIFFIESISTQVGFSNLDKWFFGGKCNGRHICQLCPRVKFHLAWLAID